MAKVVRGDLLQILDLPEPPDLDDNYEEVDVTCIN
jgi:hypothetical protein